MMKALSTVGMVVSLVSFWTGRAPMATGACLVVLTILGCVAWIQDHGARR